MRNLLISARHLPYTFTINTIQARTLNTIQARTLNICELEAFDYERDFGISEFWRMKMQLV